MNPVEQMTQDDIHVVNHMIANVDMVNKGDFKALLEEHGAYTAIALALDKSLPIEELCFDIMETIMKAWSEEQLERDPDFTYYAYLKAMAEPIHLFPHH